MEPTGIITKAMLINSRLAGSGMLLVCCLVLTDTSWAQDTSSLPQTGVQPGDLIQVVIWREADLSGEFPVDENGTVVLPLLGRKDVRERTAETVVDDLLEEYSRYLRNPSIRIAVLRRISVQGEVRNPGLYPVDATISLLDVIAIAGGLTATASTDKIYLIRQGDVSDIRLEPNLIVQRSPLRSGDQIFVGQKSWFSRNSGILAAALISAAAIVITNAAFR